MQPDHQERRGGRPPPLHLGSDRRTAPDRVRRGAFPITAGINEGDDVEIDNAVYLATQTYHRHQVPSPDFYVWDQYLAGGEPIYPQRPEVVGPRFARGASGSAQSGRFAGKMIVVEALMDEAAYPWQADWYRTLVKAALGPRLDDSYRLWFVDHAMHTTPMVQPGDPRPVRTTRVVSYVGVLQQALRDVSAWVEKGQAPPPSTSYEVADGQVVVPPRAADRKGIQPVVQVTANGGERAEVEVGEAVAFSALVEVPAGAGTIVHAEWDFEGTGDYPVVEPFDDTNSSFAEVKLHRTYAFSAPGHLFPGPSSRLTASEQLQDLHRSVLNLGRVRVVVTDGSDVA